MLEVFCIIRESLVVSDEGGSRGIYNYYTSLWCKVPMIYIKFPK